MFFIGKSQKSRVVVVIAAPKPYTYVASEGSIKGLW